MDPTNWVQPEMWPDSEYREEFARSVHDYILDKDRKYVAAAPGMLDPGMPLPPGVRSYFSACVNRFVGSLFDELLRRHQPPQQFEVEESYALERFLDQPYPNEEPFNPIALTMPRGNSSYEDPLSGFGSQTPLEAGDPRRPISELHCRGAVQADLCPPAFGPEVFLPGTHEANIAEQMQTFTEVMRTSKSSVEPFHQIGELPLSRFRGIGAHDPGLPGRSALGRKRRADSGKESTSAGSQTAIRRTKTKRNQPPSKTAASEAGQSSRSFGANVGSVDESPRNTTGAGTVSKEGFKHECKKCGERFEFPARLKSHMEIISHAERRYRCVRCGSVFSRKSSLKRHEEAPTACKSKVQSGNDSPPPSTSESGARDAAFRRARPPSMASPSHGNVSPSIAGNQSISSRNQYCPSGPAPGPRTSFGRGGYLSQMDRASSQQHRSLQPSIASRSSHRPSSAQSCINPRILQPMNDGCDDCD